MLGPDQGCWGSVDLKKCCNWSWRLIASSILHSTSQITGMGVGGQGKDRYISESLLPAQHFLLECCLPTTTNLQKRYRLLFPFINEYMKARSERDSNCPKATQL